ncbi:MAG: lamin tail domain-containing protein [Verrucomicrobiaceae bacterium]
MFFLISSPLSIVTKYTTLLFSLFLATPLAGKVWISEFVANNDGSHLDEDGDAEDWVELFNDGTAPVDLGGWSLTDDAAIPQKWIFPPGATIGSKGYVVVFASGKNRRILGSEWHTGFSLKSGGEYLGLIQGDGVTVEDDFSPEFPKQFAGASYGVSQVGGLSTVVRQGTSGQAGVPESAADFAANYQGWNENNGTTFSGSTWRSVKNAVGYERSGSYGSWIGNGGDFEAEMYEGNASIFVRMPFLLPPIAVGQLTLKMRWDDGFIAYINGHEVKANRNDPTPDWDSTATENRGDSENDDWVYYTIDPAGLDLVGGQNVLAIHGMNEAADSSDMLIFPELLVSIPGVVSGEKGYHTVVTPGGPNGTSLATVPPLFGEVTDQPERPTGGAGSAPLLITAEIDEGTSPISTVKLYYREMFDAEVQLTMNDSASGGDLIAGDGIYSVEVPTTGLGAGEMLRWRVEAEDADSGMTLSPPYLDPLDADRYYGTVALNPAHGTSQLTIMETFVQNTAAVDTVAGTTGSVFYLGEFYDNLQMDRHGQSTGAFPKKSYDVDFNKGNRFRWKVGEERVKDINLLTNWADKSKVRNLMAYEFLKRCGAGHHYAFPVRVERNGDFFSIADMVEDGDERYLDRIGLSREGTLYKMYDRIEVASKAVKKSRKELGTEDLQALIDGLDESNSRNSRREYAYDNLDIAATVNHLAAYVVIGISDTGHKNFYMYRDTEGNGEWRPLPWDVDLSAGRRWNSTDKYFDDSLFSNMWIRSPNRLWELIHETPEYRHMIMRRIGTLRDQLLLSNAAAAAGPDWFSDMVGEWRDRIDPVGIVSDADLDYDKWGSWGNEFRARPAAGRILLEWLPDKRNYMFSGSRNHDGVPIASAQPSIPDVTVETVEFLPSSGNQGEEYVILKNNENTAIDLSGFTLAGAVEYSFPPGTVVPAGSGTAGGNYIGTIHVVKDGPSFRARSTGPTSGEYRFIQDGYQGQFSARGETLELRNEAAQLVDSFTYTGTPTLAQEALRVTELNYHPAAPTAEELAALPGVISEDFEFIELRNISGAALDLEGVQFTEGIEYTFGAGTSIAADERILLVKNPAAFALRYPGLGAAVYGPFGGLFNNDGETVRLVDKIGENILVFTYNDVWFPETDGPGATLVLVDPDSPYDGLDEMSAWTFSATMNGTPGTADSILPTTFTAWQNEKFNPALHATIGAAGSDPDNDGLPNWKEYAFGTDPVVKDEAVFQAEIVEDGGQRYLGARTRRINNGSDLIWTLESGDDLGALASGEAVVVSTITHGDGTETVVLREATPVGGNAGRFARLRLVFQP